MHSDEHDVFVLQIHGSKQWQVYRPVPKLPPEDKPVIEAELHRGDSLYMPKGFPHAASTQRRASAHLTVGILSYTWSDLIREMVKQGEQESEFAEPLPLRFAEDPVGLGSLAAERVRSFQLFLDKQEPREAAERLARRFLTGRRPILVGQLRQFELIESLDDSAIVGGDRVPCA